MNKSNVSNNIPISTILLGVFIFLKHLLILQVPNQTKEKSNCNAIICFRPSGPLLENREEDCP